MNLIQIKQAYKIYKNGPYKTKALDDINLSIKTGEIVVILGPSGSGKTTLLNCLSGLDRISEGSIFYRGKEISKYSDLRMTKFRKKYLGFIFQNYNLLNNINVYHNVQVGAALAKKKVDINEIIETVGLTSHKKKSIHELSGGEQQRVSIARALAKQPEVMFCDEPTGALDEHTGKKVLKTLIDVNNEFQTTMIIVTHNPGIALIGDRIIKMNSGRIVENIENKRKNPLEIPWG